MLFRSERLVGLVSETVKKHLVEHHALTLQTALQLTGAARERITVDLVDQAAVTDDFAGFASHLHKTGRLNASLMLRALARGQVSRGMAGSTSGSVTGYLAGYCRSGRQSILNRAGPAARRHRPGEIGRAHV